MKKLCFFIDGPAGSGKSYLINCLIKNLRIEGIKILAQATTGIAADLLEGGRTVHSRFKLPLFIDKETEIDIKASSKQGQELISCNLIIIDEVSAMGKDTLDCIDRILRKLMDNDKLFGGKVMVLCGDFRQTMPVI
jgi:nucleoside-triphosphatase THEP1